MKPTTLLLAAALLATPALADEPIFPQPFEEPFPEDVFPQPFEDDEIRTVAQVIDDRMKEVFAQGAAIYLNPNCKPLLAHPDLADMMDYLATDVLIARPDPTITQLINQADHPTDFCIVMMGRYTGLVNTYASLHQ